MCCVFFRITESLVGFLNMTACEATVHWLVAIPLVHFLCNASKPFKALNNAMKKHNDISGEWWGDCFFKRAKETSRRLKRSKNL